MVVNWDDFWTKNTLVGLGLGQLLSLLVTSTGFSSSELAKKGINAPTSQSFFNYVLLALVYGSIMLYRRQALKGLAFIEMYGGFWFSTADLKLSNGRKLAKWYYYILLGAVDVEANFLGKYPSNMSSSFEILPFGVHSGEGISTKYRFKKLAGVVICIAGLVVVVFSDVHSADRSSGSNPIKGDLLVLAGATLYGVTNVGEEYFVKSADRVELMAFLGIFGAIISAIQIVILERDELRSIHWTAGATFPFVGFSVSMFLFYSGVPILLKISGSTMLNLSLLTSDMWAVLIRIFAYQEKVDWMYFVAFAAVAFGLIVYSGGDKIEQNTAEVADEEAGAGCSEAGHDYGRKQDGSSSSAAGEGSAEKACVS
ncbi:hypothetical protein SASPL_104981 [Salvia splendens]|uniref:Solute carrier family 35, member F1/2 n=1 Tax=Salvia splendens TaxID=180675 RepID=A0A8X8YNS5_SALSN|nr:hypothetical protein SASPL_104981 [Salvia splendens]